MNGRSPHWLLANDNTEGNVRIRKTLLVLGAVMLPLGTVALLQSTAFAKTPVGTGTTSCTISDGTLNFNPPLSAGGTAGAKKEVTTVTASLTGCSGGSPVGAPTSISVKAIKTKAAKHTNAGECSAFETGAGTAKVKATIDWATVKKSKFNLDGLTGGANPEGELGFTGSFTVKGSYAGTGNLSAYLTQASTDELGACSGSISTLYLDPTTSSGTI
jgi:hypothetical protein